jgi:hypothetical protein
MQTNLNIYKVELRYEFENEQDMKLQTDGNQ